MIDEPERTKAYLWLMGAVAAALLIASASVPLIVPVLRILGYAEGLPPLTGLGPAELTEIALHAVGWVRDPGAWLAYLAGLEHPVAVAAAFAVPASPATVVLTAGLLANPFEFHLKALGDARFATDRDLMSRDLLGQSGMILGATKGGFIGTGSRYIRLPETVSAMLICPPGAGKTAGIVIPNLLADWPEYRRAFGSERLGYRLGRGATTVTGKGRRPRPSFIVNDPKGELYLTTAGHLASKGYDVIRLAWGSEFANKWNPISFDSLPGGRRVGRLREELIAGLDTFSATPVQMLTRVMFEVRETSTWWEPLLQDPGPLKEDVTTDTARDRIVELVPKAVELFALQARRQQYVERMTNVLIAEPRGGANDHFVMKGRDALNTLSLFIIYRCERDGRESSYGALLDAMSTDTNVDYQGQGGEDDNAQRAMLTAWFHEARESGFPSLVTDGLTELSQLAGRERSGVISTVQNGLQLFKNQLTRQRTNACDFRLDDVRFGKRPLVVYLDVPLEDMTTLGRVSGMFVEATATRCISQNAEEIKRRGRPVIFLLDEFWTLPKGMQSLMQIPALGRGQWVQMLLVGQSLGQIAVNYEKEVVNILMGAVSTKIVMSQNDDETAQRFEKIVGNRTVRTRQVSSQGGFDPKASGLSWNTSRSAQGVPLVPAQRFMSLNAKRGEQIVLVQGMMNRPVQSVTPYYFKAGRPWSLLHRANRPHRAPGMEELRETVREARARFAALGEDERTEMAGVCWEEGVAAASPEVGSEPPENSTQAAALATVSDPLAGPVQPLAAE
jgi:type IV secretion system protein VirD4